MSITTFILIYAALLACSNPTATNESKFSAQENQSLVLKESALQTELTDTISTYSKTDLLGKFNPAEHPDFIRIQSKHTDKPSIFLRKKTYEDFINMHEAALKDGVHIKIISATRNFDYQKGIWEKKWHREKYKGWKSADIARDILKYSAMPGASRHHWGTDVDFNSVELAYFSKGEGKKLYDWLVKNGSAYGFYQTYTSKENGRTGYEEEKWHWSYMPLAGKMLVDFNATISYSDFEGFSGCEAAKSAQIIEWYINGIDKSLLTMK